MDRIPFLPFFLQSFPESTIILALGLQWTGIRFDVKRILPLAALITVFSYVIRAMPIVYGVHSFVQIVVMVLLMHYGLKLNWQASLVSILIGSITLVMAESLILPLVVYLTGLTLAEVLSAPWLRILVTLPHMLLIGIAAFYSRKKGWVLVDLNANTEAKPRIYFFYIVVLFQTFSITVLNLAFYAYHSGTYPSVNLEQLHGLVNVILISVSLTTVYIANRILKLAQQEALLEERSRQMEAMQETYLAVRSQRHDFHNHVTSLYGFLKIGKFSAAQEYMETLYEEVKNSHNLMNIGIPALSGLLHTKAGMAQQKGIEFKLSIDREFGSIPLSPVELTGLLGNLIDNALEAVPKDEASLKMVRVELLYSYRERGYSINVFNTSPQPSQETMNKFLQPGFSTKDKNKYSGLGLSSVNNITNKYGGQINFSYDTEESLFKVMIKIPAQPVERKKE